MSYKNRLGHLQKSISVAIFLSGCSSLPSGVDDQSGGFSTYEGPTIEKAYADPTENGTLEYALYSLKPKRGQTRYFVVVSDEYEGHWRQYLRAIDEDGERYEALSILNHPHCELFCNYEDRIEFEIPAERLKKRMSKGISFTLQGPAPDPAPSFEFSPQYIQTFLDHTPPTAK